MKFKIKTRRLGTPSVADPNGDVSVYPIVNELRNSSPVGAVMIALETAFWSRDDFEAAFDAGTDSTEQDLRSLQLDCIAVSGDMHRAFGMVHEELSEDQRVDLPDLSVK